MRNVYAERLLPREDILLFDMILNRFRYLFLPQDASCHSVAAAVAERWPSLRLQHGRVMSMWQHSWLVTSSGNIIDAYPIAIYGGPLLLDGKDGPWPLVYVAGTDEPRVNLEHIERIKEQLQ